MVKDRNIGVAMDFSKESILALKWAIDNLLDKGETLYVIHVKPSQGDEPRNLLWSSTGASLIPLAEFRDQQAAHKYEINIDSEVLNMLDTPSGKKQDVTGKCDQLCANECNLHCNCSQGSKCSWVLIKILNLILI